MPRLARIATPLLLLALAACGAGRDEDRAVMQPEDTVFRDLVTAPGTVEERSNTALEAHRAALEEQLRQGEGTAPAE